MSTQRQRVKSSQIRSIGYDTQTSKLDVEFHSGSVYRYEGVPLSVADELLVAPSISTYFGQNIKDKYETFKDVDGVFVPLSEAKASKASVSLLKRLLQERNFWHEGQERPPHAMFQIFKVAGTEPATMHKWFESLLQVQCSKAIKFLKDMQA